MKQTDQQKTAMKRNSVKQTTLAAGEKLETSSTNTFRKVGKYCYAFKISVGCLGRGNRTIKTSFGEKTSFYLTHL